MGGGSANRGRRDPQTDGIGVYKNGGGGVGAANRLRRYPLLISTFLVLNPHERWVFGLLTAWKRVYQEKWVKTCLDLFFYWIILATH